MLEALQISRLCRIKSLHVSDRIKHAEHLMGKNYREETWVLLGSTVTASFASSACFLCIRRQHSALLRIHITGCSDICESLPAL